MEYHREYRNIAAGTTKSFTALSPKRSHPILINNLHVYCADEENSWFSVEVRVTNTDYTVIKFRAWLFATGQHAHLEHPILLEPSEAFYLIIPRVRLTGGFNSSILFRELKAERTEAQY